MSDDMGFSDLGCYGGEIDTPNLNALAANGLRFTQFYNTARCCPTRASLLTGLYPHQAGIGHMIGRFGLPRLPGRPEPQLRHHRRGAQAGGLPHLHDRQMARDAVHRTRTAPSTTGPCSAASSGSTARSRAPAASSIPATLCRDNTYITPQNDPEYKPETYYYTDALSDNAVQVHPGAPRAVAGQAVLPVHGLHRGPLAHARPGEGYRQVQGQVRQGLRPTTGSSISSG